MTRNRNGGHPHIEDRRELRYENLGLAEAKANLSKLVQEVVSGSEPEIVIAIGGTPVARIVPCRDHPNRALGIDAAAVTLPANLAEPNADIVTSFAADVEFAIRRR